LTALGGHSVEMLRFVVFSASGAAAGLVGALVLADTGCDPFSGMPRNLLAATAVIVGGRQVFEGSIIGGLAVGILQSLSVIVLGSRWQDAVTYSLLIALLLVRPEGLMGRRNRLEDTK
jgi:branched-chain amino acid transport system permease protein